MENTENTEKKAVTVELTDEQYAFLTTWQKKHEKELGIEIPITAMINKAIDGAMRAEARSAERADRPPRDDRGPRAGGDRGPRSFGDKPRGDRPSFGGGRAGGGRPGFGARPSRPGARGPKFDMADDKKKRTRTFD